MGGKKRNGKGASNSHSSNQNYHHEIEEPYQRENKNKGRGHGRGGPHYSQENVSRGRWQSTPRFQPEHIPSVGGRGRGRSEGHTGSEYQHSHSWNEQGAVVDQRSGSNIHGHRDLNFQLSQTNYQETKQEFSKSQTHRSSDQRYFKYDTGASFSSSANFNGKNHELQAEASVVCTVNNENPMSLTCPVCLKYYDENEHTPKCLTCGHTFCFSCLGVLLTKDSKCGICRTPIASKSMKEIPTNFALAEMVSMSKNKKHYTAGSADNNMALNKQNQNKKSEIQTPKEKSPHGSKCLENGFRPTAHCAKCQQWVCDECGRIDHPQKGECALIPLKETLEQMKQAHDAQSDTTCNCVGDTINELNTYSEQLKAYSMVMKAAFECIEKEQERVKNVMQDGKQKEEDHKTLASSMAKANNLSKALTAFEKVEESCLATQAWANDAVSQILDRNRIIQTVKELLLTSVQLTQNTNENSSAAPGIYGETSLHKVKKFFRLTDEGGRLLVHASELLTPAAGTRALPIECIISCVNFTSNLTFLDLATGGTKIGRVYIRLLGDTVRGRQFLSLCAGDQGFSFRKTNFHRIWWKGLSGEHIWGGDFKNGDGSGDSKLDNIPGCSESSLKGRSLPIKAGLVAGRYEQENISSLFRIYTKASENAKDDAAFAVVEHGLHFVSAAVNQKNIKDVTIIDCGIVLENHK